LGLVPRQYSSGGKSRLYHISRRGDTYLRTLLIHGARAVLRFAIIPMGFCYPGRGNGGDKPPRRECAQLWLDSLWKSWSTSS